MTEIRRADISDTGWLYLECKNFAKTYGSKIDLSSNIEYAHAFLKGLITQHLVYIAEIDNEPVGFIAGLIAPHHFNPDILQLSEILWWVKPENRSSRVGAKLFEAFVEYGKKHCDWITFAIEDTTPISDESLVKRGFRLKEKAYLMECR